MIEKLLRPRYCCCCNEDTLRFVTLTQPVTKLNSAFSTALLLCSRFYHRQCHFVASSVFVFLSHCFHFGLMLVHVLLFSSFVVSNAVNYYVLCIHIACSPQPALANFQLVCVARRAETRKPDAEIRRVAGSSADRAYLLTLEIATALAVLPPQKEYAFLRSTASAAVRETEETYCVVLATGAVVAIAF